VRLAAVNLKTGAFQFEVPLGFMLDPQQYPESGGERVMGKR
jgi:hypothetical protein